MYCSGAASPLDPYCVCVLFVVSPAILADWGLQNDGSQAQGFQGVEGAGRLITSSCIFLDPRPYSTVTQAELAEGHIHEPDVQWRVEVTKNFSAGPRNPLMMGHTSTPRSLYLTNVMGRGKEQVSVEKRRAGGIDNTSLHPFTFKVVFTARIDTASLTYGISNGEPRYVGDDGFIGTLPQTGPVSSARSDAQESLFPKVHVDACF